MTWQSSPALHRAAFCCGPPSSPQLSGWDTEPSQGKSNLRRQGHVVGRGWLDDCMQPWEKNGGALPAPAGCMYAGNRQLLEVAQRNRSASLPCSRSTAHVGLQGRRACTRSRGQGMHRILPQLGRRAAGVHLCVRKKEAQNGGWRLEGCAGSKGVVHNRASSRSPFVCTQREREGAAAQCCLVS